MSLRDVPRMIPSPLPSLIRGDQRRSAEVEVYDALKHRLLSGWTVYYSRPWLGIEHDGAEREGEADFLLVHQRLGILVLEVKGGRVKYDPDKGRWTTRNRHGEEFVIKYDPFIQAGRSLHNLRYHLKAIIGRRADDIRMRRGVVLPHVSRPDGDLGLAYPEEVLCCSEDMHAIDAWILHRMGHGGGTEDRGDSEPGKEVSDIIDGLVAPRIQLDLKLGRELEAVDRQMGAMTDQQRVIAEVLAGLPRSLICGGAGTGKTVLASHIARLAKAEGERVLVTCASRALAKRIAFTVPGISVAPFAGLAALVLGHPGIGNGNDLDAAAADLMSAAAENTGCRFNRIIVDEGQDLSDGCFKALDGLMAGASTPMHVFMDANQKLGMRRGEAPPGFTRAGHLTINLRNTRKVFEVVKPFHSGPISHCGPDGLDPAWIEVSSIDQIPARAASVVNDLQSREDVRPDHITVLAPAELHTKICAHLGPTANPEAPRTGCPTLSTVLDFKGLESRIVILSGLALLMDSDESLYVALSRASGHLILIGTPPEIAALQRRCHVVGSG